MPCPCRAPSMSLCKRLLKDVSRQPVGDLPSFGFFRLPRGVSRLAVRIFPATSGFSRRTRHYWRTAGARHSMCELERHATAVARHGIGELAFTAYHQPMKTSLSPLLCVPWHFMNCVLCRSSCSPSVGIAQSV